MKEIHKHLFSPIEPPLLLTSKQVDEARLPFPNDGIEWFVGSCECGIRAVKSSVAKMIPNSELHSAWRRPDGEDYNDTLLKVATNANRGLQTVAEWLLIFEE